MALKKKYKGNTLPEVLIAIVIISFSSALGITIYINIQENSQPFLKIKASEIANRHLIEVEKNHNYIDDSFKEDEFFIQRTIKRSVEYPDCIVVKISISAASEKKISEIQKLIHVY